MIDPGSEACIGRLASDRQSTRSVVAAVVLGLVVLMVTKGPVFWVRFEWAPLGSDFIDDIWVQTAFVVASALLMAVAWPAIARLRSDPLAVGLTLAVPVLAVLSVLWSVSTSRTVEQSFIFFLGTLATLLAGAYVHRLHALVAVWGAMQLGVGLSLFASARHWPLALDMNGKLAGIYFNRNSLGPVAVTAFVASVCLLAALARRRSHPALLSALGVVALVDVMVWFRTGSLTAAVALVCAAACTLLLWFAVPRARNDDRRRRTLAVSIASIVGVVAVFGYSQRGLVADRLGRDPTLAGRTIIWSVVDYFISQRSLSGWGFMAVWTQPEIADALAAQNALVYEAHSGYREVLLGMGVFGLAALVGCFAIALARSGSIVWRCPDALALWSFGVVVYVIVVNLGETYVGANLLPWTLLAVAIGQTVAVRTRSHSISQQ